jgi:hypothetical protein
MNSFEIFVLFLVLLVKLLTDLTNVDIKRLSCTATRTTLVAIALCLSVVIISFVRLVVCLPKFACS